MMNKALLMGTVILLQLHAPTTKGDEYEPCYVFEVEESMALEGRPPRSRKQTCFTTAELPWTPLEIEPQKRLVGFVSTREPVRLRFQEKEIQGQKITWKRDPKLGPANIHAATVTFWISKTLPTPRFMLSIGGGPDLPLPEGCLKLEVVPHEKAPPGVEQYEVESTFSVSGECKKTTAYKLGDKSLSAYEFDYAFRGKRETETGTLTLSRDIPGDICAMKMSKTHERHGKGTGTIRIVSMTPAPLPEGLDLFSEAGFAYAPPAGYSKAAKPEPGEIVRYVKGNAFISVRPVKLGEAGLPGLHRRGLERMGDGTGLAVGASRNHHIAGHMTFCVSRLKANDVGYIFAENGGRGYRIAVSGLDEMRPPEIRSLLRGWRWKKAEKQAQGT